MVGTSVAIQKISEFIESLSSVPVVLDPILASSSGYSLLEEGATTMLSETLCPLATLATPNLLEAALLLDTSPATTSSEQNEQATELAQSLGCAVLLKGGHMEGIDAIDVLAEPGRTAISLATPRHDAAMRGTGCALSSLIAANLARGLCLEDACRGAKEEVSDLLRRASTP